MHDINLHQMFNSKEPGYVLSAVNTVKYFLESSLLAYKGNDKIFS